MPTATFYHLNEKKRARVLEAAIDEFAQTRFSDASVNRIVKAAGISRGSFYQYFKDKEDIYIYVLEYLGQQKLDIFSHYHAEKGMSFFDAILDAIPAIFDWIDRHPKYNQIALHMPKDDSEFIQRILGRMRGTETMVNSIRADITNGLVRPEIDPELLTDLYASAMTSLIFQSYATSSREQLMKRIYAAFEIIGNGILVNRREVPCESVCTEE